MLRNIDIPGLFGLCVRFSVVFGRSRVKTGVFVFVCLLFALLCFFFSKVSIDIPRPHQMQVMQVNEVWKEKKRKDKRERKTISKAE